MLLGNEPCCALLCSEGDFFTTLQDFLPVQFQTIIYTYIYIYRGARVANLENESMDSGVDWLFLGVACLDGEF